MKPNQKSAFQAAARISKLAQATESMALQLTEFIDFIEYHNPDIDRVAATQTAAFVLQDLRTAFLEEPEMMQQLSAIALRFSQG
jgi:succinylarginine dihydrolase